VNPIPGAMPKDLLIAGILFLWIRDYLAEYSYLHQRSNASKPFMPDCCQRLPDGSDKSTCKNGLTVNTLFY
jgi:hypothetical protein